KSSRRWLVETLSSSVLINEGQLQFKLKALPLAAQFSRISAVIAGDFDSDGTGDLLLAGNFFPYTVRIGRADAGLGLLMKGQDKDMHAITAAESGFYADGDVRKMVMLKTKTGRVVLIARNNDQLKMFRVNQ
ncbi:MAG TPA: hypothetical protein VK644_03500, partial [Chitinophagaceae bacterium]|nr:hypothetical protein [Chitinophagaceae bacterium]